MAKSKNKKEKETSPPFEYSTEGGMTTFGARNKVVGDKFVMVCKRCKQETPNSVQGLCDECFDQVAITNFGLKKKLDKGRGTEPVTTIKVKETGDAGKG